MEAVRADSEEEWGGETGLEEPMWRLGLGGGLESYPERPDEPDCIYYSRTGFCGYGNRCRFNHPGDRGMYYKRTGMCKFGASCKYHHPKQGVGSSAPVALNFYGLSMRPGEEDCSYYVKTGQCKFGITCKFHHPQPEAIQMPVPTPAVYPTGPSPSVQTSQQYGVMQGNWPISRPAMVPGSYVPGSYGPMILPPGVIPVPNWTPYLAASQSTQPTGGATPVYRITQLSPLAAAYPGPYLSMTSSAGPSTSSQKEQAFPDRPGLPECQYYLRTGYCKFGAMCKYHHPPEWSAAKSNYVLSPMGLPLRPGAPLCFHYAQSGVCKFGPSCKFDHPMRTLSYSPSASSLTDVPVAPYPVGSTITTLAPSSSSSDLRPLSGFSKDAFSSQISSTGSVFSKIEGIPQSNVEQDSISSSGGSSASHGGETHASN